MGSMSRKTNRFDRSLIDRERRDLTRALRVCARPDYATSHPWLVTEYLSLFVTRISNLDHVQDIEDALSSIFYLAFCYPTKTKLIFRLTPLSFSLEFM